MGYDNKSSYVHGLKAAQTQSEKRAAFLSLRDAISVSTFDHVQEEHCFQVALHRAFLHEGRIR